MSGHDLRDERDLDGRIHGKGCDTDGEARVATGIAKKRDKQVGSPIDHLGHFRIVRSSLHKSVHHRDAFDAVQRADDALQGSETVDGADAGKIIGFLGGDAFPDAPGLFDTTALARQHSRHERKVTGDLDRNVAANGRCRLWQYDTQLCKLLIYRHTYLPIGCGQVLMHSIHTTWRLRCQYFAVGPSACLGAPSGRRKWPALP